MRDPEAALWDTSQCLGKQITLHRRDAERLALHEERMEEAMQLVMLFLALFMSPTTQDRPTLPELARRSAPDPVLQKRMYELVGMSVDSMVPQSDLVLLGRVASVTTRLSEDQKDLHTDAVIEPIQILFQRAPVMSARPGEIPIVVRRWGGEAAIDGVRVIQEDGDVRQFRAGEQLLVLLRRDSAAGVYTPVSSSSASFQLSGNQVTPLSPALRDHSLFVRVKELQDFIAEVRSGSGVSR